MRKRTVTVNDKMQKRLPLCADGAGRAQFRSRIQARADAAADARARRVRRQVHDRLPRGVPRRLVRERQALADAATTASLNFFGVDASQPLSVWREKGWIHPDDPRGWFQWYCRYYMGRRMPDDDRRQIERWKAIRRHVAQVEQQLRAGRPDLPQAPAPGAAALGLRQPQDLTPPPRAAPAPSGAGAAVMPCAGARASAVRSGPDTAAQAGRPAPVRRRYCSAPARPTGRRSARPSRGCRSRR